MSTRRKYHQSEIQTFLKCGKMWEFRYVQGIKTPPKAALTVGGSVDRAVTHNLVEKVRTGTDIPLEAVLETFSTAFERERPDTEWGEDDPGEQKDIGIQLVRLHHENIAPAIEPETVQEEFVIETDAGYDLGGTIDLTEKSGMIADTKTSKGRYTLEDVDRQVQPILYDFAFEAIRKRPAKGFRFDVLVKPTAKKPPEFQQIQTQVTEDDRVYLFDLIDNMHRSVQAGVTNYAPDGAWWCSSKWCGYWNRCPKGKGRK